MRDEGIRNLPIVSGGRVVGIVSLRSLLNHYSSHLERLLDETVNALASAIGQRDPYTADHQRRVSLISVAVAKRLGMESGRIDGLRMAALSHDVGKIDVPIELLAKPGRLTRPSSSSSSSIRRPATASSRRSISSGRSPRWSCSTTSGWTARATPSACAATRS